MRAFLTLTKSGIVWFVLFTAAAGYAMAFDLGQEWNWTEFLLMLVGLYFVSSGSFAINQAQEWQIDNKMPRTQKRPIPKGQIYPWQAYVIGISFIAFGLGIEYLLGPQVALLSLLTVVLYNGLYTLYWKKKWSFGAVPGAIPGAMPVVIGYSVVNSQIFSPACVYLFLIMFFWQMPHFWAVAIRYKDDYAKAQIPVLPVHYGVERTIYHMGLYMFGYVGLALAAPWFSHSHIVYLILVVPMSIKLLVEFFRYLNSQGQSRWLPFFLWVNISLLVFVSAPVIDKWVYNWMVV